MENTIYEAPMADLTEGDAVPKQEFYVVSTLKFSILFLGTFSFYTVYWFYRNWKMYKNYNDEDISPVARGIFSVFFVHSLFEYVDGAIENKDRQHNWSPSLFATLFILFAIAGRVTDSLSSNDIGSPLSGVISIILMFPTCFVLAKAQAAINVSQGDEQGKTNSKLGFVNYLWCIPGALIWLLVFVGLAVVFGLISA